MHKMLCTVFRHWNNIKRFTPDIWHFAFNPFNYSKLLTYIKWRQTQESLTLVTVLLLGPAPPEPPPAAASNLLGGSFPVMPCSRSLFITLSLLSGSPHNVSSTGKLYVPLEVFNKLKRQNWISLIMYKRDYKYWCDQPITRSDHSLGSQLKIAVLSELLMSSPSIGGLWSCNDILETAS